MLQEVHSSTQAGASTENGPVDAPVAAVHVHVQVRCDAMHVMMQGLGVLVKRTVQIAVSADASRLDGQSPAPVVPLDPHAESPGS